MKSVIQYKMFFLIFVFCMVNFSFNSIGMELAKLPYGVAGASATSLNGLMHVRTISRTDFMLSISHIDGVMNNPISFAGYYSGGEDFKFSINERYNKDNLIEFSSDNAVIFFRNGQGCNVALWDIKNNHIIPMVVSFRAKVFQISPNHKYIAGIGTNRLLIHGLKDLSYEMKTIPLIKCISDKISLYEGKDNLVWSPNSKFILFFTNNRDINQLSIYNVDKSTQIDLVNDGGIISLGWSIDSETCFALSENMFVAWDVETGKGIFERKKEDSEFSVFCKNTIILSENGKICFVNEDFRNREKYLSL